MHTNAYDSIYLHVEIYSYTQTRAHTLYIYIYITCTYNIHTYIYFVIVYHKRVSDFIDLILYVLFLVLFMFVSFLSAIWSFCELSFVGFLLLHKYTFLRHLDFSLNASISYGTRCLALCAFCCYFHVGIDKVFLFFIWVMCLDISWRISNLFLTVSVY